MILARDEFAMGFYLPVLRITRRPGTVSNLSLEANLHETNG